MIGNANELLSVKKYNDNDIICKFGYTNDLVRRTNQHYKTYKKELQNLKNHRFFKFCTK